MFIGVWLSLVERYVRDVEVACSNHVTPIILCLILPFFYQNPFIPGKTNGMLSIKLYLIVIVTVGIILKRDNAAHCI